ncbi:MAG: NAD(P)H-dependent oxidoreductase subunit E [Planctomycetota bacterium]|nr:NAD(P)H-dependent oxidoreductase subunit E [Planctomycetota bacterium]
MSENLEQMIKDVCKKYGNDRRRMVDVLRQTQAILGYVPSWSMDLIARETRTYRVEVESVVSFYAFLSRHPKGKIVIRLADDVVSRMKGSDKVADALKNELGIEFGQTTADGNFSLDYTACIGMNDQCPAALVNDVVVTNLTAESARQMVTELKHHMTPTKLVSHLGDGNNADSMVHAMVMNNIREKGEVIFGDMDLGQAIRKAIVMTPREVIRTVKAANLRGRGGAGFPTGMKWDFTHAASEKQRYVICNADEGEPGTFKDRVILTEKPDLLFEGMTIAGYAVGSDTGIVYLRAEYAYLKKFLENVLIRRRKKGLLGKNICNKTGLNFDIRIQMGAGAYICGEETALISSCEGLRGDPKTRPPFPARKGYLDLPTVINNVETLCCAARILEKGPEWFTRMGTVDSAGTKMLSISGDCDRPGVYEVPFGVTLTELLEKVGAKDTIAIQVGGPSGQMVGPAEFKRRICFSNLATGGSIIVIGRGRNILDVVDNFLDFFIEESCGFCTPCRVGNILLKKCVSRLTAGDGEPDDLKYLQDLGDVIKATSRCGLGQTSPNPVLTTIKSFPDIYENLCKESVAGQQPFFHLDAAVAAAEKIAGHKMVQHEE